MIKLNELESNFKLIIETIKSDHENSISEIKLTKLIMLHFPCIEAIIKKDIFENLIDNLRNLDIMKKTITNFEKFNITTTQKRIIKLVSYGYLNKEISGILTKNCSTIKTILSRLYKKCGVSNRIELANLFKTDLLTEKIEIQGIEDKQINQNGD